MSYRSTDSLQRNFTQNSIYIENGTLNAKQQQKKIERGASNWISHRVKNNSKCNNNDTRGTLLQLCRRCPCTNIGDSQDKNLGKARKEKTKTKTKVVNRFLGIFCFDLIAKRFSVFVLFRFISFFFPLQSLLRVSNDFIHF